LTANYQEIAGLRSALPAMKRFFILLKNPKTDKVPTIFYNFVPNLGVLYPKTIQL
jgi:hypothetical protein